MLDVGLAAVAQTPPRLKNVYTLEGEAIALLPTPELYKMQACEPAVVEKAKLRHAVLLEQRSLHPA